MEPSSAWSLTVHEAAELESKANYHFGPNRSKRIKFNPNDKGDWSKPTAHKKYPLDLILIGVYRSP